MLKNFKDTTNRECVTSKLVEERGNKGIKNTREKKKNSAKGCGYVKKKHHTWKSLK